MSRFIKIPFPAIIIIALFILKTSYAQESFKLQVIQPPPLTIHMSDDIYAAAVTLINLDTLFRTEGNLSYEHQWTFWDGYVSHTIDNAIYTLGNSGVFQLTIVDENSCTTHGSVSYFEATNIGILYPDSKDKTIQVFPNPNKGAFNIVIENCLPGYSIQVINLLGVEILHVNLEKFINAEYSATIIIPGKDPGIYILLVKQYQEVVFNRKIVLMHP